jgi:hypothetical protein
MFWKFDLHPNSSLDTVLSKDVSIWKIKVSAGLLFSKISWVQKLLAMHVAYSVIKLHY